MFTTYLVQDISHKMPETPTMNKARLVTGLMNMRSYRHNLQGPISSPSEGIAQYESALLAKVKSYEDASLTFLKSEKTRLEGSPEYAAEKSAKEGAEKERRERATPWLYSTIAGVVLATGLKIAAKEKFLNEQDAEAEEELRQRRVARERALSDIEERLNSRDMQ